MNCCSVRERHDDKIRHMCVHVPHQYEMSPVGLDLMSDYLSPPEIHFKKLVTGTELKDGLIILMI